MLLQGKVATIAGSDDAIGKATAIAMVKAGAKVVLTSTEENGGEALARAIRDRGGEAIFIAANITLISQLEGLFDRIYLEFGRLDVAFNNVAVVGKPGFLTQLDINDVAETIDINVFGSWILMKYQIEQMLKNKSGAIVNNIGILGMNAMPTKSIESSTRAAIASMTKAAAIEYANQGIRINAVAPGFIKTSHESNNGKYGDLAPACLPMGRWGKPEEVAKAVVWLCSAEASFTTGHVLPIDGGYF